MPLIIPILATGYLLTIYLLLILAARTNKTNPYLTSHVAQGGLYSTANSIIADDSLLSEQAREYRESLSDDSSH